MHWSTRTNVHLLKQCPLILRVERSSKREKTSELLHSLVQPLLGVPFFLDGGKIYHPLPTGDS